MTNTEKKRMKFLESYMTLEIPSVKQSYPMGWMSSNDLKVIYNASCQANGPILEIGPFVGLSTMAIALGLRTRRREKLPPIPFDTIDFGITSSREWQELLKEPFAIKEKNPRLVSAVYHPGGTIAVLIKNLEERNLLSFVTSITRGDFLNTPLNRKYGYIFCDTTHSDYEVHRCMPKIAELAAPGATLVFDDVITEQREKLICEYLDVKRVVRTNQKYPSPEDFCKVMLVELN